MKKYIVATLLFAISFTFSYAETLTDDIVEQIDCARITNPLKLGSRDKNTNGDVTTLQIYLSQAGYLDSDPTGYFGNATKKAVQSFQSANGLSPIGSVGPATRAKIKAVSCTSTNSDDTSVSDHPLKDKEIAYTCPNGKTIRVPNTDEKRKYVEKYCSTSSEDRPVACTMEYRSCADGSAMPRDPSNCKWLEDKCPVKKEVNTVSALRIYISGSEQASITKENVSKESALAYCKEKIYANQSKAVRCMWGEHEIYSVTGSSLNILKQYQDGDDHPFVTKENVSKEYALKDCKDNQLVYPSKKIRCTWGGSEIYSSNPLPLTESMAISETVKCVFNGATTEQKCYGYSIATSVGQNVNYFSCSGAGSCSTTVKGVRGSTIKWSASCGESTSTVLDGTDKYATFTCTR